MSSARTARRSTTTKMPFLFSLGVSGRDTETMSDRGRRYPISDAELAENVGDVQRGRLRTDEKRLGDLAISEARRHQGQNLLLASCETKLGEGRRLLRRDRCLSLGSEAEATAPGQTLDPCAERASA